MFGHHHYVHPSNCTYRHCHANPQEASPTTAAYNRLPVDQSPEMAEAVDVSAIVSALAKQQSEGEEEGWECSQSDKNSYDSDNEHNCGRGGKKGKCFTRENRGAGTDSTGSNASSENSAPKYHVSKEIHELGKMFIKSTLLPRPKSEGNFQEPNEDDAACDHSNKKDTSCSRRDSHHSQHHSRDHQHQVHDKEHEQQVHSHHSSYHLPVSLSFHPLKKLQSTFHRSDILYPPAASATYTASQSPPHSGIAAPTSTPKSKFLHSHSGYLAGHYHQHQHHIQPASLKASTPPGCGGSSSVGTGTSSHSSHTSPAHLKAKPKVIKRGDTTIGSSSGMWTPIPSQSLSNVPTIQGGHLSPITVRTPPGGLPVVVTPVAEYAPGSTQTQSTSRPVKRTKYTKGRTKSSEVLMQ